MIFVHNGATYLLKNYKINKEAVSKVTIGDNVFIGAMVENYVAQALHCNSFPLYYWKNNNTAELDFVLQIETDVIPVEVKKGKHTKSISMNMFIKKYNSPYAIRFSQKNFGFENKIKSIPLYAVFCLTPI